MKDKAAYKSETQKINELKFIIAEKDKQIADLQAKLQYERDRRQEFTEKAMKSMGVPLVRTY